MRWTKAALAILFLGERVSAQTTLNAAGREFFEKQIRPVLVSECYGCHSAEAKKAKGGLQLDTRAGLFEGGDSCPALVPGKPAESLLLKALRHQGPKMPSKDRRLDDTVVAQFEAWIARGAPDPREGKSQVQHKVDYVEGRKHWAYQPVRGVAPPTLQNGGWATGAVDRYVLARIEAKGLSPAPDAAPRAIFGTAPAVPRLFGATRSRVTVTRFFARTRSCTWISAGNMEPFGPLGRRDPRSRRLARRASRNARAIRSCSL